MSHPVSHSPLVDPRDVATLTPAPLVLDLRPAEQFAVGHLPGALHLDLWGLSLIDTSEAPLRAFMWMIGHLFSLRGVTPDRPVVVYEQDSGMRAARALWFLEYLGHPRAFIIDGGLNAWTRAGLEVTSAVVAPTPSDWHGTPDPARIATWRDVLDRLGKRGHDHHRHAQRRGVLRRSGAREARRRDSRRSASRVEEESRSRRTIQVCRRVARDVRGRRRDA